ncbi:nuclear transport factor 2 family protein [Mucilaginibacter litoreus]|uniref:Nuclear transport factor 2 family protein n=1 Tax=Mucilaginibacter litoreus TaxID=1048221 RepID=A0ABW3AUG5_9SPHI
MGIHIRTASAALGLIVFTSCHNPSEKPADTSRGDQSRQVIEEHFKYLNTHDLKGIVAQYADSAKITTADRDGESYGRQGADQMFHQMFYVSPDARYLVDDMIVTDSLVVVEYDATGLRTKANDPVRIDLRYCSIFTIKDGKIIREATYTNPKLYHNK